MQTSTRLELSYGLSASEVADHLRHAADRLGLNKRVLAFYLADMDDRRLYQVSGHGSTVHFGDAHLDMEPRRTREYVQVGRALQDLYQVDEAFREGSITWSKVVALLPVVQRDTQRAWVDFAKACSFRELRREVGGCRPGHLPGEGSDYGLIRRKMVMKVGLSDETFRMLEAARMRLSTDPLNLLTDEQLIQELLLRDLDGAREQGAVRTPEPKETGAAERNDEDVPDEVHAAVLRRDRHRCRNCHNHLDVAVHHIVFRSEGGSNDATNLISLCNTCHAGVHRGFLVIAGNPGSPEGIRFTSAAGDPVEGVDRGVRTPSEEPGLTPVPA
jgi:hypothetical protein